jgi:hypothetical protein
MQYKELHGMLGHPVRAAKSLIVSEREEVARTLIFVLRCRCKLLFLWLYFIPSV